MNHHILLCECNVGRLLTFQGGYGYDRAASGITRCKERQRGVEASGAGIGAGIRDSHIGDLGPGGVSIAIRREIFHISEGGVGWSSQHHIKCHTIH